jgi:hypothetical protein
MEQILSSIANTKATVDRPHFIYASSLSSSLKPTTTSTCRSTKADAKNVHDRARTMDEALASYYSRHHGIISLGCVYQPSTVHGITKHRPLLVHYITKRSCTQQLNQMTLQQQAATTTDLMQGVDWWCRRRDHRRHAVPFITVVVVHHSFSNLSSATSGNPMAAGSFIWANTKHGGRTNGFAWHLDRIQPYFMENHSLGDMPSIVSRQKQRQEQKT